MAIKEAFKFDHALVLFAGALKLRHQSYLLFFGRNMNLQIKKGESAR